MAELTGRALTLELIEKRLLKYERTFDPDPLNDIDARSVRAEIERRGLEDAFIGELCGAVGYCNRTAWNLVNATPEQQSRAALKAVEGAHA